MKNKVVLIQFLDMTRPRLQPEEQLPIGVHRTPTDLTDHQYFT